VQTHNYKKIRTFNVLVWHLIPSGYAVVTSCLSLRKLQPTVAEGPRTTFVASVTLCHDSLHSNFDIGFAISDVNSDTNKELQTAHQW